MRLVPVFTLETHNRTNYKCLPKFVQTDNASLVLHITANKNKIPHGKTKNLTANQILHSKNKIALVLPWVFAFAERYLVFAVKYLALP